MNFLPCSMGAGLSASSQMYDFGDMCYIVPFFAGLSQTWFCCVCFSPPLSLLLIFSPWHILWPMEILSSSHQSCLLAIIPCLPLWPLPQWFRIHIYGVIKGEGGGGVATQWDPGQTWPPPYPIHCQPYGHSNQYLQYILRPIQEYAIAGHLYRLDCAWKNTKHPIN